MNKVFPNVGKMLVLKMKITQKAFLTFTKKWEWDSGLIVLIAVFPENFDQN